MFFTSPFVLHYFAKCKFSEIQGSENSISQVILTVNPRFMSAIYKALF